MVENDSSCNHFLECEEDGLHMRDAGPWAAEKLDYLCRYLNAFTVSMHNSPWRKIHYIDLFSGPGKCIVEENRKVLLGSPLLALKLQNPFDKYYFVDSKESILNTLKKRCEDNILSERIEFLNGDGNIVVKDIVDQILEIDKPFIKGVWHSLNLAFLDPPGLQLKWKTVAELGKVKKMDLIIYYPEGPLNRRMVIEINSPNNTSVDKFFGGIEWREIYQQKKLVQNQSPHRDLINLYKEKLKSLGYKKIEANDPLMRNKDRNAPLYRLILASKNGLGYKIWNQVTRRDVYGQSKLF
jgi:three-Cys-motif partner protein